MSLLLHITFSAPNTDRWTCGAGLKRAHTASEKPSSRPRRKQPALHPCVANPEQTDWNWWGRAGGRSKKTKKNKRLNGKLAEREGFEPSVPLRVLRFSRPAYSATLAPLRRGPLGWGRLGVEALTASRAPRQGGRVVNVRQPIGLIAKSGRPRRLGNPRFTGGRFARRHDTWPARSPPWRASIQAGYSDGSAETWSSADNSSAVSFTVTAARLSSS